MTHDQKCCARNKEQVKLAKRVWRENNKEQIKLANRAWRENNKEQIKLANRAWRENNKEQANLTKRAWYQKNKEQINLANQAKYQKNKEQINLAKRARYQKNKEQINLTNRAWYQNNKEQANLTKRAWYQKNKEQSKLTNRAWKRASYQNNLSYRLRAVLRSRVRSALKNNSKSARTMQLIGCSVDEAKLHLERQFKPGMSWDNYGNWEIDHIKPISRFDLSKEAEQRLCFHFTNIQPLWKEDNMRKGNRES